MNTSKAAKYIFIDLYSGISNPSGAVALDSEHFIVADDEDNSLRIYNKRITDHPLQTIPLKDVFGHGISDAKGQEIDLEGAAELDGRLFWISNFRLNRIFLVWRCSGYLFNKFCFVPMIFEQFRLSLPNPIGYQFFTNSNFNLSRHRKRFARTSNSFAIDAKFDQPVISALSSPYIKRIRAAIQYITIIFTAGLGDRETNTDLGVEENRNSLYEIRTAIQMIVIKKG